MVGDSRRVHGGRGGSLRRQSEGRAQCGWRVARGAHLRVVQRLHHQQRQQLRRRPFVLGALRHAPCLRDGLEQRVAGRRFADATARRGADAGHLRLLQRQLQHALLVLRTCFGEAEHLPDEDRHDLPEVALAARLLRLAARRNKTRVGPSELRASLLRGGRCP